jgi:hypothetical protein
VIIQAMRRVRVVLTHYAGKMACLAVFVWLARATDE